MKKSYVGPELTLIGSLKEVTRGVGSGVGDILVTLDATIVDCSPGDENNTIKTLNLCQP